MKALVLHPGKMGSTVGQALIANGHSVSCVINGRSEQTRANAKKFSFALIDDAPKAFANADIVVSICMGGGVFPNAEMAIHAGFKGIYIDANHIGDPTQEALLAKMLSDAGITYVEGAIYGWPYPSDHDQGSERTIYLTGANASTVASLLHGDIFDAVVANDGVSAKEIKRQREKSDKQTMMAHTNHGAGIVEFHNVIDIDYAFVDEWLERRRLVEPHDYEIDEHGFYINRGGYKFTAEQVTGAPERYMNLTPADAPHEDIQFHLALERAMFDCINQYGLLYPEVKDCLWWRTDAHVAVYGVGAGMGMHHDNAVGGASANENPIFNVVSGSLIIDDRCNGGELGFRFIESELKPIKGSVVLYPSSFMGAHKVNRVLSGRRISYLEFFGHGTRSGQTKRL